MDWNSRWFPPQYEPVTVGLNLDSMFVRQLIMHSIGNRLNCMHARDTPRDS